MSDWAQMQAEMLVKEHLTYSEAVKVRVAVAEALWQAFENGIREGELRYLRPRAVPVLSRTTVRPVTLPDEDDT